MLTFQEKTNQLQMLKKPQSTASGNSEEAQAGTSAAASSSSSQNPLEENIGCSSEVQLQLSLLFLTYI